MSMAEVEESCDVLIAGGGPAGSALASLLARWGRDVVLVDDARPRVKPPEETIVAIAPIFERLGIDDLLAGPQAAGTARHGAIWGSNELAWRRQGILGSGYKVDRASFDRALRERARTSGARVLEGWRVTHGLDTAGALELRDPAGGVHRIESRERVAAVGGGCARAAIGARRRRWLPATFAIWGLAPGDESTDATLIEAVAEGWLWWLPLATGEVCVTLFADREELRARGPRELFAAARRGALGPARGAEVGELRTNPATPTLVRATGRVQLVGAAATSVDPLSSQGIETALASAEDAAYALNTLLERPALRARVSLAREAWETRLFELHGAKALGYYAAEGRFPEAPFWRTRHAAARELPPEPRTIPARLRVAASVERCTALRRRGRQLVETAGFRVAESPYPRHAVGNVELAALFELLEQSAQTAELEGLAARHAKLVALSPSALRAALLELLRAGFLEDASEAHA